VFFLSLLVFKDRSCDSVFSAYVIEIKIKIKERYFKTEARINSDKLRIEEIDCIFIENFVKI